MGFLQNPKSRRLEVGGSFFSKNPQPTFILEINKTRLTPMTLDQPRITSRSFALLTGILFCPWIAREDISLKTLLPTADAHVQETSPAANSGTATDLLISSTSGSQQEAFLRYDLSGITGTIEQARLILWSGAAVTGASVTLAPLADADDGWSETAITWNNKPVSLTSGTVTVSKNIGNDYDGAIFDVTALAAATLATDAAKLFSVRVSASSGSGMIFGARENGSNRKKPYIHLTVRAGTGTTAKLMHIGDSITRGANGAIGAVFSNSGWRYYLQNQLIAADVPFRCVGPRATDGSISSTYHGA